MSEVYESYIYQKPAYVTRFKKVFVFIRFYYFIIGLISEHQVISVENYGLLPLAKNLANYTVFMREDNTIKTYMSAFNKWGNWAKMLSLKVLPANSTSVTLFILSKIQMGEKFPSIQSFFYGIKFIHKTNGLNDPTENYLVKNMYEAAHRL